MVSNSNIGHWNDFEFDRLLVIELAEEDFLLNAAEVVFEEQLSFRLFPNPVDHILTIELPSNNEWINIKNFPLTIYNAIGQKMNWQLNYDEANTQIQINVNAFPSGMYSYKLGNFTTGQFIKINH